MSEKQVKNILIIKTGLILGLLAIVTSCSLPIWSGMKKRAVESKNLIHNNNIKLFSDNFKDVYQNWDLEVEDGCILQYSESGNFLDIKASKGLILWYKTPLEGDFKIKYEALVVDNGELLDRVSDLNCIWKASDPLYPDSILTRSAFRKGAQNRFCSLQLYSMSVGGNGNTSTHFCRYDGHYNELHNGMLQPKYLVEYKDEAHLILSNHWYNIELSMKQGRIQYIQDGEMLVDYLDPYPFKRGWFGIRTAENHLRIRNFTAYQL